MGKRALMQNIKRQLGTRAYPVLVIPPGAVPIVFDKPPPISPDAFFTNMGFVPSGFAYCYFRATDAGYEMLDIGETCSVSQPVNVPADALEQDVYGTFRWWGGEIRRFTADPMEDAAEFLSSTAVPTEWVEICKKWHKWEYQYVHDCPDLAGYWNNKLVQLTNSGKTACISILPDGSAEVTVTLKRWNNQVSRCSRLMMLFVQDLNCKVRV